MWKKCPIFKYKRKYKGKSYQFSRLVLCLLSFLGIFWEIPHTLGHFRVGTQSLQKIQGALTLRPEAVRLRDPPPPLGGFGSFPQNCLEGSYFCWVTLIILMDGGQPPPVENSMKITNFIFESFPNNHFYIPSPRVAKRRQPS